MKKLQKVIDEAVEAEVRRRVGAALDEFFKRIQSGIDTAVADLMKPYVVKDLEMLKSKKPPAPPRVPKRRTAHDRRMDKSAILSTLQRFGPMTRHKLREHLDPTSTLNQVRRDLSALVERGHVKRTVGEDGAEYFQRTVKAYKE